MIAAALRPGRSAPGWPWRVSAAATPCSWLLNTLLALPSVVVGLVVYLLLSRAGPLGSLGILFTPTAMVVAQTILVLPMVAALTRQLVDDAMRDARRAAALDGRRRAARCALILLCTSAWRC